MVFMSEVEMAAFFAEVKADARLQHYFSQCDELIRERVMQQGMRGNASDAMRFVGRVVDTLINLGVRNEYNLHVTAHNLTQMRRFIAISGVADFKEAVATGLEKLHLLSMIDDCEENTVPTDNDLAPDVKDVSRWPVVQREFEVMCSDIAQLYDPELYNDSDSLLFEIEASEADAQQAHHAALTGPVWVPAALKNMRDQHVKAAFLRLIGLEVGIDWDMSPNITTMHFYNGLYDMDDDQVDAQVVAVFRAIEDEAEALLRAEQRLKQQVAALMVALHGTSQAAADA